MVLVPMGLPRGGRKLPALNLDPVTRAQWRPQCPVRIIILPMVVRRRAHTKDSSIAAPIARRLSSAFITTASKLASG
jgi:hypothetical protein